MTEPLYLLWDIDGTIMWADSAGRHAIEESLKAHYGIENALENIRLCGKTDTGIAQEIADAHGIENTPEFFACFRDNYLAALPAELESRNAQLLPGVQETLDHFAGLEHANQWLLTGNLARGAEIKLSAVNVWQYFADGALLGIFQQYAQTSPERPWKKIQAHNPAAKKENVWVLGDTPADIACGKAHGLKTIGVSTGSYSYEELLPENADHTVKDIRELIDLI